MSAKLTTSLLSALIFLTYGLFASKVSFLGLGAVFLLMALAEYLSKKEPK